MSTLIALFSSVMFVGGLVIVTRQCSAKVQLVIGVIMIVLAAVLILK